MAITPLVLSSSSSVEQPALVTVHPAAVATILDQHLRRPRLQDGYEQDRVLGTLMGARNEAGEVNVLSSFGVPFGEVEGKLLLDTDSLKQQLDVVVKANPKLSVVGWYATSPQLNSWTPLIHDEYAALCSQAAARLASPAPYISSAEPIHLTLDVNTLKFSAYASRKLGLAPSEAASSNRLFVPLRTEMKVGKKEQAGLDVLTNKAVAKQRPESSAASTAQLVAPLVSLNTMLTEVSTMLDAVLEYVKKVTSGSEQGDVKIGRFLLETLANVPLPSSQKGAFEEDFNTHLADLLMVSYLANVVRVNLEVSTRASMLHDARLAPRTA